MRRLLNKEKAEYLLSLGYHFRGWAPIDQNVYLLYPGPLHTIIHSGVDDLRDVERYSGNIDLFWSLCRTVGVVGIEAILVQPSDQEAAAPLVIEFRMDYS